MGLWLMTLQTAWVPQGSGQGSMHLCFTHTRSEAHSALATHSGLHPGGEPRYSGKQEQTACPLFSLQRLFCPQGDGWQGLVKIGRVSIERNVGIKSRTIPACKTRTIPARTYIFFATVSERIARVPGQATAGRHVIDHLADRVLTAGTWTGVLALESHAALAGDTVRAYHALWSTAFVRVSKVPCQAGAGACSVSLFAKRVCSARGWHAGLWHVHGYDCKGWLRITQ